VPFARNMYSVRPSWLKPPPGGLDLDMYLSTDDEGDDGLFIHQKKARDEDKEAAELAQAKRAARRQMERQEIMEIERQFAVLDNIRVGDPRLQKKNNRLKSKSHLDPSDNPYINYEAAEARDSDSDLADEESFASETSSLYSDVSLGGQDKAEMCSPTTKNEFPSSKTFPADGSDLSEPEDEFPTLYENYCASRQVVEAQIQQELKEQVGNQSSSSSSSISSYHNDQNMRSSSIDDGSETDMEVEASFSSVFG